MNAKQNDKQPVRGRDLRMDILTRWLIIIAVKLEFGQVHISVLLGKLNAAPGILCKKSINIHTQTSFQRGGWVGIWMNFKILCVFMKYLGVFFRFCFKYIEIAMCREYIRRKKVCVHFLETVHEYYPGKGPFKNINSRVEGELDLCCSSFLSWNVTWRDIPAIQSSV